MRTKPSLSLPLLGALICAGAIAQALVLAGCVGGGSPPECFDDDECLTGQKCIGRTCKDDQIEADTSTAAPDIGPATPDTGSADAAILPADAGPNPNIAGPCEDQDECPGGSCVLNAPGGYCQVTCGSDDDCEGGLCIDIGEPGTACLNGCDQSNACREDWLCSSGVCQPGGAIAGPCIDEGRCLDPVATCLPELPGGGFCSVPCVTDGTCEELGVGLTCVIQLSILALPTSCFSVCNQANEGSCRDGYVCSPVTDGGYACLPDCRQYDSCLLQTCNRQTGLCGE